jgi:hypothetical protein
MERRGWLVAVAASAAVAGLGCVTHPSQATTLRLAATGTIETGPPVPAAKGGADKPREGWLRHALTGLSTMPWYMKVGLGSLAGFMVYAFTRHDGGGGSSGPGHVCPVGQNWSARDSRCQ